MELYHIQKILSPGLYGQVLLCSNKQKMYHSVVIKVMHIDSMKQNLQFKEKKIGKNNLQNIIINENGFQERTVQMKLTKYCHPNIVNIVDTFNDDKNIYLVLPYCEKGDLYQMIVRNQELHTNVNDHFINIYYNYLYGIANGLAFIHSKGYAHRDLSLENILVTKDNQCKIGDFGLAVESSTNKRCYNIVGKMYYIAPEVYTLTNENNKKGYDPIKADIWAFGIIFIILLCGSPLFHCASFYKDKRFFIIFHRKDPSIYFKELLKRIILQNHNKNNYHFYIVAIDLIVKICQIDPDKRPTIKEILAHPFFRLKNNLEQYRIYELYKNQQNNINVPNIYHDIYPSNSAVNDMIGKTVVT